MAVCMDGGHKGRLTTNVMLKATTRRPKLGLSLTGKISHKLFQLHLCIFCLVNTKHSVYVHLYSSICSNVCAQFENVRN